jgi:hypothetical protein
MNVRAILMADSTSTRAVLQSEGAVYQTTFINFTITPEAGTASVNYITCDGVTSVASASVSVADFDTHLKDKRPPHTVSVQWTGYGTDMGPVSVAR